jgi:hypothetical protein
MSQKIRATPRSAGFSSSRIEILPSRRAAIAWLAWLALVNAMLLFAVALPLPVRIAVCVLVTAEGARALRSFVLLLGARGVRAIGWDGSGLTLEVGTARRPMSASIAHGSFRVGRQWLALTFETPAGALQVLVDGRYQDARAFRRLCREFSRGLKGSSGRDSRPS